MRTAGCSPQPSRRPCFFHSHTLRLQENCPPPLQISSAKALLDRRCGSLPEPLIGCSLRFSVRRHLAPHLRGQWKQSSMALPLAAASGSGDSVGMLLLRGQTASSCLVESSRQAGLIQGATPSYQMKPSRTKSLQWEPSQASLSQGLFPQQAEPLVHVFLIVAHPWDPGSLCSLVEYLSPTCERLKKIMICSLGLLIHKIGRLQFALVWPWTWISRSGWFWYNDGFDIVSYDTSLSCLIKPPHCGDESSSHEDDSTTLN